MSKKTKKNARIQGFTPGFIRHCGNRYLKENSLYVGNILGTTDLCKILTGNEVTNNSKALDLIATFLKEKAYSFDNSKKLLESSSTFTVKTNPANRVTPVKKKSTRARSTNDFYLTEALTTFTLPMSGVSYAIGR